MDPNNPKAKSPVGVPVGGGLSGSSMTADDPQTPGMQSGGSMPSATGVSTPIAAPAPPDETPAAPVSSVGTGMGVTEAPAGEEEVVAGMEVTPTMPQTPTFPTASEETATGMGVADEEEKGETGTGGATSGV